MGIIWKEYKETAFQDWNFLRLRKRRDLERTKRPLADRPKRFNTNEDLPNA
jgi:hypothetical protein